MAPWFPAHRTRGVPPIRCRSRSSSSKRSVEACDGHVSRMQSAGKYSESHTWMLVELNNNIFDVLGASRWPYLDRHPKCTASLKELVARVFLITTG
jgi:hypothetical protein